MSNTNYQRTDIQCCSFAMLSSMSQKNRRLGTDDPVEFEKQPVEVGDLGRIIDNLGGI